jgi:hypothetical protein
MNSQLATFTTTTSTDNSRPDGDATSGSSHNAPARTAAAQVVCAKCGSTDVEHAHWVNPNTGVATEPFGSWNQEDARWCNDCHDHCELVDRSGTTADEPAAVASPSAVNTEPTTASILAAADAVTLPEGAYVFFDHGAVAFGRLLRDEMPDGAPYRAPHHTAGELAMVSELATAAGGVMTLDEAEEISQRTLSTIARVLGTMNAAARPKLVFSFRCDAHDEATQHRADRLTRMAETLPEGSVFRIVFALAAARVAQPAEQPRDPEPTPAPVSIPADVATEPRSPCMSREEAIRRIRNGLKKRSGKTWSVTGGRGTAWGWLRIDAPPARRNYDSNGNPGGSYMSPADKTELANLLNLTDVHFQGVSIPSGSHYYEEYVARAEGREPEVFGTPYWD